MQWSGSGRPTTWVGISRTDSIAAAEVVHLDPRDPRAARSFLPRSMTKENGGKWLAALLFGAAMLVAMRAHAELSAEELAKLAQNPVGT